MPDTTNETITEAKQKKIKYVEKLMHRLESAQAVILTHYQGLKHQQLEDLRTNVKKGGADFAVTKNSLLKRALKATNKSVPDEALTGPTATLIVDDDVVPPVKTMLNFFKEQSAGKVKIGFLGDTQLQAHDIEYLATLPGRETLLAQLLGQLMAPMSSLHYALSWNIRKLVWTLDTIKSTKS